MNEHKGMEMLLNDGGALTEAQVTDLERRTLMLIEKKRRQVRRMRWIVPAVWGTLAILFVIGAIIEAAVGHGAATSTIAVIMQATLVIALVLSVSWYVRNVSLRFDSIQQALAAIQDRLGKDPGHAGRDAG